MQIKKSPTAFVIFAGVIICAVLIAYNSFYNPPAQEVKYIPMTSAEIAEVSLSNSYNSHFIGGKLNINLATADELAENLDGISTVLAQRIVEYRTENGDFNDIAEIMNVKGISEKKFDTIKNEICV